MSQNMVASPSVPTITAARLHESLLPRLTATSDRRRARYGCITQANKTIISINLDGWDNYMTRIYTTQDLIRGRVNLSFENDAFISDVTISLIGLTTTAVTNLRTWSHGSGTMKGTHTFLRMRQPIDPESLPRLGLAKAGSSYTIPFAFTVPEKLAPDACKHNATNNDLSKETHLLLPPSLAGKEIAEESKDSLAPKAPSVVYSVYVTLRKRTQIGDVSEIVEKQVPVRIMPTREEEPPLCLSYSSGEYQLHSRTDMYELFPKFGANFGRLSAETMQPGSLRLPHNFATATELPATTLRVHLRFDPAHEGQLPPRLKSTRSIMRAYTFFSVTPRIKVPALKDCDRYNNFENCHQEPINLESHICNDIEWMRHDVSSAAVHSGCPRQVPAIQSSTSRTTANPETLKMASYAKLSDSTAPIASTACAESNKTRDFGRNTPTSSNEKRFPFYTASLRICITLPRPHLVFEEQAVVPTFESCLVSRNYSLSVKLYFSSTCSSIPSDSNFSDENSTNPKPRSRLLIPHTKITLIVPLQVSVGTSQPSSPFINLSASTPIDDRGELDEALFGKRTHQEYFREEVQVSRAMSIGGGFVQAHETEFKEHPPTYYASFQSR